MTTAERTIPHVRRWPRTGSLRRPTGVAVLLAGLVFAGMPVPASAAPTDTWTAAFGDAGNSTTNAGESSITAATAARVATAWVARTKSASPYPPAVVNGYALRVGSVGNQAVLVATSAVTGATVATVPLPGNAQYYSGLTVVGGVAVVPFNGWGRPGGVLAVDLRTRSIRWTSSLPPATPAWWGDAQAGPAYTDGQRVYVSGSSNVINAYRLSDGALLWTAPHTLNNQGTPNGVDGMAVGDGVVYTGGAEGIVAYDAATGHRLWAGPGGGVPVVAGGHVYAPFISTVVAYPAGGCGHATCTPLWSTGLPGGDIKYIELGGADDSAVFATYEAGSGRIARLSAATGRVEWAVSPGRYTTGLVRGGDTIWLNDEYVDSDGVVAQRILGYSTQATGSTPLRTIPLTSDLHGFPQHLGIAAGTLFQQLNAGLLIGYRVSANPTPPANAAPTASFTVTPEGMSVAVDGTPSSDADGEVKTYAWDFGDGVTGWGSTAAHTYAAAGTYRITLTVTDWAGATGTTSRSVTVAPPAGAGAFATDTFDRNVTGGLGSADVGGMWTALYGTSRQSVSGGSARLLFTTPGTAAGAYLGAVSKPSADVTATVTLNGAPTGGGAMFYLIGRRTGDDRDYRLRVRLLGDGSVRLIPTVRDSSASERFIGSEVRLAGSYPPGTPLHVRFEVSGSGTTTLRGKAWTGNTEPADWAVSRTDSTASVQGSGSVGLSSYLSGSATNVPVTFSVTEFSAGPVG